MIIDRRDNCLTILPFNNDCAWIDIFFAQACDTLSMVFQGAIVSFTKCLALEEGPNCVRVNTYDLQNQDLFGKQ